MQPQLFSFFSEYMQIFNLHWMMQNFSFFSFIWNPEGSVGSLWIPLRHINDFHPPMQAKILFVAVFLGYNQYPRAQSAVVLVVKGSQKVAPQLKVSFARLGEDGNWTCDLWFTRHRFIPYTTAPSFQCKLKSLILIFIFSYLIYQFDMQSYLGLAARKPVFGGLRITKAQTSLRICAVWPAPLLFTYCKVSYPGLIKAKFQFSS